MRKGRRGRSEHRAANGASAQKKFFIQEPPSQMPRPPARGVCGRYPYRNRSGLPPPSTALTCAASPSRGPGRSVRAFGRPFCDLRTAVGATAQPAPARSISGHRRKAIETSPRVRRSCLAVVPHTWLARPCAPFRGSRCIVDNKGMLAFCQDFVRTFVVSTRVVRVR